MGISVPFETRFEDQAARIFIFDRNGVGLYKME